MGKTYTTEQEPKKSRKSSHNQEPQSIPDDFQFEDWPNQAVTEFVEEPESVPASVLPPPMIERIVPPMAIESTEKSPQKSLDVDRASGDIENNPQEQEVIDDAIRYLLGYVHRNWEEDMSGYELAMHGSLTSWTLVYEKHLNGKQIRAALNKIRRNDPVLFNKVLFEGELVYSLLGKNISGLQDYKANEEDIISGFSRGEQESLLKNKPEEIHHFTTDEIPSVLYGFGIGILKGMWQGYYSCTIYGMSEDFVVSIKGMYELFSSDDLMKALKEDLPVLIYTRQGRFKAGEMLGEASADEVRRICSLVKENPFGYGEEIGILFGKAIIEIILSILMVGLASKAMQSIKTLKKFPKLLKRAEDISQSFVRKFKKRIKRGGKAVDKASPQSDLEVFEGGREGSGEPIGQLRAVEEHASSPLVEPKHTASSHVSDQPQFPSESTVHNIPQERELAAVSGDTVGGRFSDPTGSTNQIVASATNKTNPIRPLPRQPGGKPTNLKDHYGDRLTQRGDATDAFTYRVKKQYLGKGTDTNSAARKSAQREHNINIKGNEGNVFDAGHLRSKMLGGKGWLKTTFPQFSKVNRGIFRLIEEDVADLVRRSLDSDKIFISVQPRYSSASKTVADQVYYQVRMNGRTIRRKLVSNKPGRKPFVLDISY